MQTQAQSLKLDKKAKAIAIVAHPDDEVIWLGGSIQRFKDVDWTVLSLCRQSDIDREPKFQRVSKELGVKGVIQDLDDNGRLSEREAIDEAKRLIKDQISDVEFDFLFTHGANGEYGHKIHKQVHEAIKELMQEGVLRVGKILFFDYQKKDRKILPIIPADKPDYFLELRPGEYEEKRRIVAEMYGYPYDGIDVNLCTNVEAFKEFR